MSFSPRKTLVRITRGIGKSINSSFISALIVFLYKSSDADIFGIGLQKYGIGKARNFEISGEKYIIEKILLPNLSEDDLIMDIGANTGEYSNELLKYFPKREILSIEPNPVAYDILKKITGIKAYNLACGKKDGERTLYVSSERQTDSHASLSRNTYYNVDNLVSYKIKCVRVDNFLADQKRENKIGFIKVDAEGHDFEVLEGMGALLSDIKFIQFEFNEKHVYTRTFIMDFYNLLSATHYLFRIDNGFLHDLNEYHPYLEIFRYQNLLAISKRIELDYTKYTK
jgi:FkbM family methyltransferase